MNLASIIVFATTKEITGFTVIVEDSLKKLNSPLQNGYTITEEREC